MYVRISVASTLAYINTHVCKYVHINSTIRPNLFWLVTLKYIVLEVVRDFPQPLSTNFEIVSSNTERIASFEILILLTCVI